MIPKPVPLGSIDDLPRLTWREVSHGYARQFLGWKDVINLAIRNAENVNAHPLEAELAGVWKDQDWKVGELIQRLAETEPPETDHEIKSKWLFLVLNWLYANKEKFRDPLQEVEEIYAEFGFPSEINQIVRFLPPTGGYRTELHNGAKNPERLYRLWADYLQTSRQKYE